MWYCSECGKKNNGKFCTRCGTKYVEIDEEPVEFAVKDPPVVSEESSSVVDRTGKEEDAEPDFEVCNAAALCRRRDSKPTPYLMEKKETEDTPADLLVPKDTMNRETPKTEAMPDFSVVSEKEEPVLTVENETEDENPEEPLPEENVSFSSSEEVLEEDPLSKSATKEKTMVTDSSASLSPESGDKGTGEGGTWVAPYLREEELLPEEENGGVDFIRSERKDAEVEAPAAEEEVLSADSVFTHRRPPEAEEDKEWKYSKRILISVGAVCGIVLLALVILVGSLFVNLQPEEEVLPTSSGVYAYVSGVKDTTPLYADKSIKSDVLTQLENGDALEYLEKVNAEFVYVLDPETEQYGYVHSIYLVKDKSQVDYGNVDNLYDEEKSLGHYYVTKTENHLTLWENADGGGTAKATLKNGYKVSLLEKTNDSYWYVFDYTSAERGYVRTAYLTDDKSKVVGIYTEPKDKTVIADLYITNVKEYLPIWSEPSTGSKVRGKLFNGEKVGLIQKTTSSFWYVYGYSNGVYGWVSTAYLTSSAPVQEKPQDTSENYVVTGTQEYLPVLSEAAVGAGEVTQIHNGDAVKVLDSSNDTFWYVEVLSTGAKGYVVKDYLKK